MVEDSLPMRGSLLIHNYFRFLEEAGYEVLSKKILGMQTLLQPKGALGDQGLYMLARLKKIVAAFY